jgi:hypothetical protein
MVPEDLIEMEKQGLIKLGSGKLPKGFGNSRGRRIPKAWLRKRCCGSERRLVKFWETCIDSLMFWRLMSGSHMTPV